MVRNQTGSAHRSFWQTSDAIFGIGLLLALAADYFLPLSLTPFLPRNAGVVTGCFLGMAGLALIIASRRAMEKSGQPAGPGKPTTRLITEGVFAYSRNPIYLGAILIFAGLGFLLNILWFLTVLLPIILVVRQALVLPEEEYLDGLFGEEYRAYKSGVRRWL